MDEPRDITQHLLRFSPDALIVIDAGGHIRFANETVTALFGYAPEQLVGKPLDTLIPERLRARHGSHLAAYMTRPGSREMGARIADLFARRADGSEPCQEPLPGDHQSRPAPAHSNHSPAQRGDAQGGVV